MTFRRTFAEITIFLFTCLYLYTGITKLMSYELSIEQNAIMPLVGSFAEIISWLLPVIEIALAVFMFLPKFKRIGLMLSTGLMLLFTAYVAYLMSFNSTLPCTCGGFLKELSWKQHLIFNTTFLALGIIAIRLSNKEIEHKEIKIPQPTN